MDTPNEWHFLSTDNLDIFARRWPAEGPGRATVVLVHGFAEHCGRYEHVAAHFASQGITTYALDLPGHGRSEGDRHIIRSFGPHLSAIRQLLTDAKQREPGLPIFLLGHSMGGMLVTLLVVTSGADVRGIVLSGPALPHAGNLGFVTKVMALAAKVAPWLPLQRLSSAAVSRNPEVVAAYENDPLVYRGRMRLATIGAFVRAARRLEADEGRFALPLFVVHGSEDQLASPAGSEQLIARASSSDKTLKIYDGLFHEVFNEPEQQQVLSDITSWIQAHLP